MTKRNRTDPACGSVEGGAGPKWTQDEAIAYECARDYLSEVLAIYCSELDNEEAREVPRQDRVGWLDAEIERLTKVWRQLRVTDHEAIEEIRAVYGALLRRRSGD